MKLCMSNIGWEAELDGQVYERMKAHGFSGLEIAPTRLFPDQPYRHLEQAAEWKRDLREKYGFAVPSMQSIWYGRTESMFGTEREREILLDYTRQAMEFAAALDCKNLVFGCPKNRKLPVDGDPAAGIAFFKELCDSASHYRTVIAMEANPPMYGTNYMNDTWSALELVRQVDSPAFLLNLDVGTMIANGEDVSGLSGQVKYIHHVHISEPGLKPIERRQMHRELGRLLASEGYSGFVSVEMGKGLTLDGLEEVMESMEEVWHDL